MQPFFTGIEEFELGVVYGDRHAHPRETLEQREIDSALGVFLLSNKPDVVVDLDDRFDLPSLNTKRGASLMGTDAADADHDLFDEIQAGKDSLDTTWRIIEKDNERHIRAGHKERVYAPYKHACLSNHTDFLNRLTKRHHSMKKVMSVGTVRKIYREQGHNVSEYLQAAIIAGIAFHHLVHAKLPQGLAIDRHYAVCGMSSISGHVHESQVRNYRRSDGSRQTTMTVPCLKDPTRLMGKEDAGLALIRNARGGEFRHEIVGIEEILQEFRDWKMKAKHYNNFGRKPKKAA